MTTGVPAATVDTRRGADDRDCVGHRDLHGIDRGNTIVGAVGGKRHAEAAGIDIIGRPGGAPQIIVGAVCGRSVSSRPFRGSCGFIAADKRAALHQADDTVADIVAAGLTAFEASDRHLDAIDGGIGRNGKAVIGAFQVMRGGATERDRCIIGVSSSDVAWVYPDAGSGSTHIRACSSVGDRGGCGRRGGEGGEEDIIHAVRCADRVGGIGTDVIRLTEARPVMLLVKAPVTVAGPFSVLVGNAMVGWGLISQTKPYWVGLGTPRLTIVPFPMAVVWVMFVTAWVVTVGKIKVVNVTSLP